MTHIVAWNSARARVASSSPALTALAERFQGAKALNAVQEVGTHGRLALAVGEAAALVDPVQHGRRGQRGERRDQEDAGDAHVEHGHAREDHERSQRRHDHLRQVLTEEDVQLLDAVDQRQHAVARPPLIEVAGAKDQHALVQPGTQPDLHPGRGAVGDVVA